MSRDTRDDEACRPDLPPSQRSSAGPRSLGEGGQTRHSNLEIEARRPHALGPSIRWSAGRDLTLPRSPDRRPVSLNRDRFRLRDSESELLATVGTFRAVALRDLESLGVNATNTEPSPLDADVRSLREQGLLQTHQVTMNGRPEHVAVLTAKGRELLERSRTAANREARTSSADLRPPSSDLRPPTSDLRPPTSDLRPQRFYEGLVKPRELSHDAQLYRMFETERADLERDGASVTRVVLDYELKAEYHAEVHARQQAGGEAADAREAFARDHELPFAGGHIHFPDVRIEYETSDGRTEHRDLELATEHYSRSQLSGKQTAGFRVYRAAGAGSRRGGVPSDPHHLEWLR